MQKKFFKVIQLFELQSGRTERGEWKSREVILEEVQDVQYPDRYLIRFSGKGTEQLEALKEGDTVTALWSASVRSYQAKDGRKVYTQSLNGWKIEKAESDSNFKFNETF